MRTSTVLLVAIRCAGFLAAVERYYYAQAFVFRSNGDVAQTPRTNGQRRLTQLMERTRVIPTSSSATRSSLLLSSAGPIPEVDLNVYNLPLDEISQQWTATLVPRTALQDEGVYLGAKNHREVLVDTVKVTFPRMPHQGLGIELLELAGGRDDGLGITIVSGIVEGGSAEGSGILPGDSISKVEIRRNKRTSGEILSETQEEISVMTECLGYDRTVDAIGSLPPAESSDTETVVLTIKRLRRKPKVQVHFQYPPGQGEEDIRLELFAGENLRRAMLVRGIKLNDPLSRRFDNGGTGDCGAEGTCATCAISIVRGSDLLSPIGTTEGQIFKNNPRWRMACKTIVGYGMREGEMTVRVNPRQW